MSDMWLKIEGIPGSSTDAAHKDEVMVLSYSWGVTQPYSKQASTTGNLASSRADFAPFSIVKQLDKSSPKLAQHCASGQAIPKLTFTLNRSGEKGGEKVPYMKYTFSDCIVSGYTPNGNGTDIPMETVEFRYSKAEWVYTETDTKGGKGGQVPGGWDLQQNKKV